MPIDEMPSVLYKFMPSTYDGGRTLLPVLKSGHIRFTQPQAMNDPYEIQGCFRDETDYEMWFNRYRKQVLKDKRKAELRGQHLGPSLPQLVRALKAIEKSGELDNGQMAELALDYFRQRLLNYGILSLTTNWQSSAMWSHYAKNHTGVCLGFDPEMKLFHRSKGSGILSLRKVGYFNERVPLAIGATDELVPNDLFFRKSTDWSYEHEWRVVARFIDMRRGEYRRNGTHDKLDVITLPIDLKCVTEILVGSRAEPSVEVAALEFAKNASRPVRVFKMHLSRRSFEMERMRLP